MGEWWGTCYRVALEYWAVLRRELGRSVPVFEQVDFGVFSPRSPGEGVQEVDKLTSHSFSSPVSGSRFLLTEVINYSPAERQGQWETWSINRLIDGQVNLSNGV